MLMPCLPPPNPTGRHPSLTHPLWVIHRMCAGQVISDEEHHDGGLRAGQVTLGRPESLSKAEVSLFDSEEPAEAAHMLMPSVLRSFAWHAAHERARDREGSSGGGPILEHGQDTQHV